MPMMVWVLVVTKIAATGEGSQVMKAIARRIKGIEDKLYMGNGQRGVFIVLRRAGGKQLPKHIKAAIKALIQTHNPEDK